MKKTGIIFILMFLSTLFYGQYHRIVPFFFGEAQQNSIYLKWSVRGGETCNGITIYHSMDDSVYTEVGQIEGICGHAASDIDYTFIHENITQSGTHYYKLELGLQGFTLPLAIEFYAVKNGYLLYPNPGSNEANLLIQTAFKDVFVEVYNMQGQQLQRFDIQNETTKTISMHAYSSGMYFFVVRTDKEILQRIKWIKH